MAAKVWLWSRHFLVEAMRETDEHNVRVAELLDQRFTRQRSRVHVKSRMQARQGLSRKVAGFRDQQSQFATEHGRLAHAACVELGGVA